MAHSSRSVQLRYLGSRGINGAHLCIGSLTLAGARLFIGSIDPVGTLACYVFLAIFGAHGFLGCSVYSVLTHNLAELIFIGALDGDGLLSHYGAPDNNGSLVDLGVLIPHGSIAFNGALINKVCSSLTVLAQ